MSATPDHSSTQTLFSARLNNVRPLVNMLRTINFKPRTLCTINQHGMMFSVEESQCVVAQAYLRTTLFTSFSYNASMQAANQQQDDEENEYNGNENTATQVSLPLDSLIECLTLFFGPKSSSQAPGQQGTSGFPMSTLLSNANPLDLRGATTVQVAYNGPGSDFELMLEERGTISVCRIATFVPEPPVDLEFSRYPVIQQLIIKSEWLHDAFDELDPTSEAMTMSISSTAPFFKISTVGENGSTEMTYSKDDKVLDSFFCSEEQENRYKLSLIIKCKSALAMSDKTKIRVNQRGFLTLQFMIPTDVDVSFVDFVYAPLISSVDGPDMATYAE